MATRQIIVCDLCPASDHDGSPVLRCLREEERELCFKCALVALKKMYGLPEGAPVEQDEPSKPETTTALAEPNNLSALQAQKLRIEEEIGTQVYMARPKMPVAVGQTIKFGNPERDIEIVQEVEGERGLYFVRLVA